MIRTWLDDLIEYTAQGCVVRVVVIETKGSTPRETGAAMIVAHSSTSGTIGGGALEYDVIERARQWLNMPTDAPWQRQEHSYHLGPELNQCCGGVVRVLLEMFGAAERVQLCVLARQRPTGIIRPLRSGLPLRPHEQQMPAGLVAVSVENSACYETLRADVTPLIVYGAGHVGRAVVHTVADLPFAIAWVDNALERFPVALPQNVEQVVSADPAGLAAGTADGAFHLVMTHSHALDEAIVAALLAHGRFAYLGLIGSATKRARFQQRLERAGLAPAAIARMVCPVGLQGLEGKEPAVIAASIAADLLMRRQAAQKKRQVR